jgi:hypothetical protein
MKPPSREAVFTSVIAGQLAGALMLAALMLAYGALGEPFLYPLQVMNAVLVGEAALERPTFHYLMPGLVAHQLGPSIFWGRVFGLPVGYAETRLSLRWTLLLGLAVGIVAQLMDVYLLMPHFQKQVNGRNLWAENVPRSLDWMAHCVYGLALGYSYWRLQPGHRAQPARSP